MLSPHQTYIYGHTLRRPIVCRQSHTRVPSQFNGEKCLQAKPLLSSACPISAEPIHRACAARISPREAGGNLATFSPEDAKVERMMNFRREFELPEGRVVIHALTIPLIEQTSELLAASFVASLTHLEPYASYVRRNIVRYLHEHQAMAPDALVLVAVLQPSSSSSETEGGAATGGGEATAAAARLSREPEPGEQVPGVGAAVAAPFPPAAVLSGATRQQVVIGSAEVSFNSRTRSSQPFLDSPKRCCYLCNMAVSHAFRRRGVATRLLGAAEELAVEVMREYEMYLHLRFVDKEAAALYGRAGFYPQAQHWPIVQVAGIQRMKLMRKDLSS